MTPIMADVKTHLRELSVAVTIGCLLKGIRFEKESLYNSKFFYNAAQQIVTNDISIAENILEYPFFEGELRTVIDNGYELGVAIFNCREFEFNNDDRIFWIGGDTQKGDPIDLVIGDYRFSLKEESFILTNMGLYTLLNTLTGSQYNRGLHVFSQFAHDEYDEWFRIAWNNFVAYLRENLSWYYNQLSYAYLDDEYVILVFGNKRSTIPIDIQTNEEYMRYTCSETREKVFSKWINCFLDSDEEYLEAKRRCSEVAGRSVSALISNNYQEEGMLDFFRVYDFSYYYAKTTSNGVEVLRVPERYSFGAIMEFVGCNYDVPRSQLNIHTYFRNLVTNVEIEFRNECRFSHGQFNGTPEAKMYIGRNASLTTIYIPII